MKKQFNILIILFLLPILMLANEIDTGKYSKQKTIRKAYIVNTDAGIDINNSYGNVTVTTWDEEKIELDILIKVSGDKESWVDQRLDDINVDIQALKHLISATTRISKTGSDSGRNNSIEINYIIKIPKKGSVKIDNKYGSIITDDLFANTVLRCQYGKLTLARLNGNSNDISIDYCNKSTIEYLKNAAVNADYSGLTVTGYGKINLSANYTDINFVTGSDLKYDCSYGKLQLSKINTVDGKGNYLSIQVDEVAKELKIDTKYSKLSIGEISQAVNMVSINTGYTGLDMGYNAAASFDFDINVKYGSFKYDGDFEMNSKHESMSSKSYQGFYRKSGEGKMTIRTEYGNIRLYKK